MNPQFFVAAALTITGLVGSSAANAQYSEGPCGGMMRGYDGREYTCPADRKPVCEQSSGRCVCLARTECGAKHDENF